MKNEDFIELVDHDMYGSMQKRNDQIEKVSAWIAAYDGEPYGNEDPSRSQIVWKLIKKQGETLISNLAKPFLGSHEIVDLVPNTHRDAFKAPIIAAEINHFWSKEFNSNKFIKSVARLMGKEGTAFIRVGWEKQVTERSEIVDALPPEIAQQFEAKGAIIETLEDGRMKITNRTILKNRPTAKPLRLEDVGFDITADTFEDIEFFWYEYVTSLSDLAQNPNYDEEAVNKLRRILDSQDDKQTNSYETSHKYNEYDFEFSDDTRKKVRLIEYWGNYDIDNTGVAEPVVGVVARYGEDRVVLSLRKNELPGKIKPFICIPLIEESFSIYGNALAYMIEDEQMFATSIVRGIVDNMAQSNNGTKFIRKGALDPINYDRLMNNELVVEVNTNDNIAQVLQDGVFNQLPSDVYNTLNMIEQQSESLSGISKFMQGLPSTEMKASSSNFASVMSQSQIRLLDMTTSLTNGLRQMFKMWAAMCQEYLSEEEIFDITGIYISEEKAKRTQQMAKEYGIDQLPPESQEQAMMLIMREINTMFNMKDLKYSVQVKVGTDGLKDIKIGQINMLMQQAGNLIQLQVVPPKVMGMLFSDMAEAMDRPDIAKIVQDFVPQPDPMAQEMAMAELEKKKAEGEKDKALAANAMARTQSEMAEVQERIRGHKFDQANKAADTYKKVSDADANMVAKQADATAKLRGDSGQKGS
jgi:hypothetical protein